MTAVPRRLLADRRAEFVSVLLAMCFFFCVLTALMVLRPARDALGMKRNMEEIRWLFVGTAFVTLALNPAFGWLVSRFRRTTFIMATYVAVALCLLGFYALLTLAPQTVGDVSGMVFYVWFSVVNLFCTMVFWGLMADRFSLEQSKRWFGVIAVGGTLGAIAGPALASVLAKRIGTPALLLVAAGFLVLSVGVAWALAQCHPERCAAGRADPEVDAPERAVIGGLAWHGLIAVLRSPYLLGISGYMLVLSVIATFIYFTRMQMVKDIGGDTDTRAAILAQIDLVTQVATLVLQLVVTGRIMKWLGVPFALALLPALMAFGFLGLAIVGSLAVLVGLDVSFKAIQRAVMRPARETLFTVVSREDKYKSKAFTDTFVYRGGDVLGAFVEGAIGKLGLGALGAAAIPISLGWAVLGWWLGRRQKLVAGGAAAEREIDELSRKGCPHTLTAATGSGLTASSP